MASPYAIRDLPPLGEGDDGVIKQIQALGEVTPVRIPSSRAF